MTRQIEISEASELLMRWRAPQPEALIVLARSIADDSWHGLDESGVLSALVGTEPEPDFEPIIPILVAGVQNPKSFAYSMLALARLRHPAAVTAMREWLTSGGRTGRFGHPSVVEMILGELDEFAETLLPVIRTALDTHPVEFGMYYLDVPLTEWRPIETRSVAERIPGLLDDLSTGRARYACETLGEIGPEAVAASDLLERLARGIGRPPRHYTGVPPHRPCRWHGTQLAAWAHWRVTGDPAVALKVFGDALTSGIAVDYDRLTQLGSLASPFAASLRPRLDSPSGWERVHAARTWWHITGESAPAVPVLLGALEPLRSGAADDECHVAVRAIGEIGVPAMAAAPLLETVVSADQRFVTLDKHFRRAGWIGRSRIDLSVPKRDTSLNISARTALRAIKSEVDGTMSTD